MSLSDIFYRAAVYWIYHCQYFYLYKSLGSQRRTIQYIPPLGSVLLQYQSPDLSTGLSWENFALGAAGPYRGGGLPYNWQLLLHC